MPSDQEQKLISDPDGLRAALERLAKMAADRNDAELVVAVDIACVTAGVGRGATAEILKRAGWPPRVVSVERRS